MNLNKNLISDLDDNFFMNYALGLAKKSFELNEVPVGSVIVNSKGKIIGQGYNRVESLHSQINHAEIMAINDAGISINNWRLDDCWIYVTLEPCQMCAGAIFLSKIKGIVFACKSNLFGFIDNKSWIWLYNKNIILIKEGVAEKESLDLLKSFFEKQRKQ